MHSWRERTNLTSRWPTHTRRKWINTEKLKENTLQKKLTPRNFSIFLKLCFIRDFFFSIEWHFFFLRKGREVQTLNQTLQKWKKKRKNSCHMQFFICNVLVLSVWSLELFPFVKNNLGVSLDEFLVQFKWKKILYPQLKRL